MPVYAYRTIGRLGNLSEGKIEADSEHQARSILKAERGTVLQVREVSSTQRIQRRPSVGRRPSPDELASTVRQMSVLIRAGVPLVEGLRSLAEQTRSDALKASLERMGDEISHGAPLSEALMAQMHIFPPLAVEMARIAEAGGNLADSLGRLAEHLEKSAEIRRKVKSALAYPIVVLCISAITVIALVTFILPRFMKLFKSMGAEIPLTTRILMTVSHVATHRWYIFIGAALLIFYLVRRYAASPEGRRKLDTMALKLPIVGDIVSKIVLSRVLASMATLLSGGVPMVQTLETSASAADNEVVKEALLVAKRQVAEGAATSESLRGSGVFPPLVIQMVTSGEKTGELPTMLDHICTLYDRETDARVKSLTSIIEPVLIVILGFIVGFVAISVILPIYSLVGTVK